jgi:hypothetical protein
MRQQLSRLKGEKVKFDSNINWLNENCLTLELSIKNKAQNYTKWVLNSGTTDYMTDNQILLKKISYHHKWSIFYGCK